MAAPILQFGCTLMCPHGGQVQVVPSQTQVLLRHIVVCSKLRCKKAIPLGRPVLPEVKRM